MRYYPMTLRAIIFPSLLSLVVFHSTACAGGRMKSRSPAQVAFDGQSNGGGASSQSAVATGSDTALTAIPEQLVIEGTLRVEVDKIVDLVDAFSRRAPLLAARIRARHVVVKGALDDAHIPPPGVDDIRRDGISWCQMAMAELWLRLVSARKGESDVLQDAWLSVKAWLNAGRYVSTVEGLDALASEELVAWTTASFADESGPLCEAFDVARERMPPPREREAPARYLSAALRAVRAAQSRLMSA